ncbi:MAG TPA: DNA mismatch endonuclease Vsr [Pirellulales bacterium]|nr:DNA mismatch endonuclease Vsr [Pirellulales bacterium]
MDMLTGAQRSALMGRVRGKDTKPELALRRLLHRMGYRFRLHRRDLPGSPDLVLPRFKLAIFVHGCFWHRHPRCRLATTPATNSAFWLEKFRTNRKRDRRNQRQLAAAGWRVLVVWQCELAQVDKLKERLRGLIEERGQSAPN